MSDTPIPTGPSLLGAWFFDERFYDAGRDRVTPLNPVGYPAELKNGVTVGVAGDPSRDFGAADFDDASNQFAKVNDALAVDGEQCVAAIFKLDNTSNRKHIVNNWNGQGYILQSKENLKFTLRDGSGNIRETIWRGLDAATYFSVVGAFGGNNNILLVDNVVRDTVSMSGIASSTASQTVIGRDTDSSGFFVDGEIAAVGRYDLSVPNAPEPSEIARRWDRLTDIPATR